MRWLRFIGRGLIGVLAVVLFAVVGMGLLLRYEPPFYRHAEIHDPLERQEQLESLDRRLKRFVNEVNNRKRFQLALPEQEVNAWLATDFVTLWGASLPRSISGVRVAFRPNRMAVAARLKWGGAGTLLNLQVRPMRLDDQRLAFGFLNPRAGAVPLPMLPLKKLIDKWSQQNEIRTQWHDQQGHPWLVVTLPASWLERGVMLRSVNVGREVFQLSGALGEGTTDVE